jgi:hypothetical protein
VLFLEIGANPEDVEDAEVLVDGASIVVTDIDMAAVYRFTRCYDERKVMVVGSARGLPEEPFSISLGYCKQRVSAERSSQMISDIRNISI